MKQQSKLLKVVSIIIIVLGVLATISSIFSTVLMNSLMQSPEVQSAFAASNAPQISMGYYAFTIFLTIMETVAGIAGVMYRSKKSVLIAGSVWVALLLINLVWSFILAGFQFTVVLSFILPILYFVGWNQSK